MRGIGERVDAIAAGRRDERAGMSVEKSRDAGFLSDTSYFRSVSRVDGTSKWSGVLKPLKGATQSPVITLGAR